MAFTQVEETYLAGQPRGRLATVAADGTPQNKPVGYQLNTELGTVDIYGYSIEKSAKFRNVGVNPAVSLVVDDAIGAGPGGVRFLEIRGRAEAVSPGDQAKDGLIRIHPRRILAYGIDPDRPGLHTRDIGREETGR